MSYPSINRHLNHFNVSVAQATDDQLAGAFLCAFREDLPLGMAHIEELVQKLGKQDRAMLTLDPNSEAGKQFARLLGPDIPRRILAEHYGLAFGFYNCCKGVVGKTPATLDMSYREQMEAQHPNFVDC